MDWNWFYSTLAQSSAAIVGIISAFIITTVVSNQTAYDRRINTYEEYMRKAISLKEAASDRRIKWYNHRDSLSTLKQIRDWAFANYDNINEHVTDDVIRDVFLSHSFSPYMPYTDAEPLIKDFINKGLEWRITDPLLRVVDTIPIGGAGDINDERDRIDAVRRDVRQHINTIRPFHDLSICSPESSSTINNTIAACVALFSFGVITPLLMLPYNTSDAPIYSSITNVFIKYISMLVVLVVYVRIMAKLKSINNGLRLPSFYADNMNMVLNYDWYSPYFSAYEHNYEDRGFYNKTIHERDEMHNQR